MPDIKLPDGKIIQFKNHVNGFRLDEKISKSLAKEACIICHSSSKYVRDAQLFPNFPHFLFFAYWQREESSEFVRHSSVYSSLKMRNTLTL